MRALRPLLVLLLAATLAACGFQLRGTAEIPPDLSPIYVQAAEGSPVRAALERRLEFNPGALTRNAPEARLLVRVLGESRSSRVAAVDRGGKVIARELHLRVRFDAASRDGSEQVPAQTLDLVRTFENPDVEVLGKQQEADLIYEDLVEDAADRILLRLRALLL
jgi:LPS-assembly lipoprotein